MSEPTFSQPERRSFLLPILLAIGALALAAAVAIHFFPATTVNIDHLHAETILTHTVFAPATKTIVIAPNESQDVLFLAETLRVGNELRVNIFLDDFNLTIVTADGRQATFKAVQKADLANLQLTFPQLKPALTEPLLRETSIEPRQAAQGTILFSLPISQATWDARQSANLEVGLYHHPSLYLPIPIPIPK